MPGFSGLLLLPSVAGFLAGFLRHIMLDNISTDSYVPTVCFETSAPFSQSLSSSHRF
jgi:hypothetical protein